jgi:type II secretory pathway component GspD/PulD (secretin)
MNLERATMLADQGDTATFRLGERYPVMNASYSSIAAVPTQLASLLGTGSAATNSLGTYPSFTYEDLGLTIKAKPTIHSSGNVTLDLDLQLTSLGGSTLNSVPIINNRSYKGVITLQDDEPAIVAGSLSRNEQQSLAGMPGFSHIPLISDLTSNHSNEIDEDEVLLIITPHIVRKGPRSSPTIVIPRNEP